MSDRSGPDFYALSNQPMAKALDDIFQGLAPDLVTREETERVERFRGRLYEIASVTIGEQTLRGRRAELIYALQEEGDFLLFRNPETDMPYGGFKEFAPHLASALGMSESGLWEHLKYVRIGRDVLGLQPGQFEKVNGLVTVKHIQDVTAGHDLRGTENLSASIRPKTESFRERLEDDFGGDPEESYAEMLQRYFWQEVAPDYGDPSQIIKTPPELAAQAKDVLGSPNFTVRYLTDQAGSVKGYRIRVEYSGGDQAEIDEFELEFKAPWVPPSVIDYLDRRLGTLNKFR